MNNIPNSFGYGSNAVGGKDGDIVEIYTQEELNEYLISTNPLILDIQNDLIFTTQQKFKNINNKTITSSNNSKLINLDQTKENSGVFRFLESQNLILHNLNFIGPGAFDCDGGDLLELKNTRDVFVDHCNFEDGCDGNFDIKGNSNFITVSWCRFRYTKPPKIDKKHMVDHRLSNLVGCKKEDKPDEGSYFITYSFCYWSDGCVGRMVRSRNASLHYINCLWSSKNASYLMGPENTDSLLEGCTLDTKLPMKRIYKPVEIYEKESIKFVNCACNTKLKDRITSKRPITVPKYEYNVINADESEKIIKSFYE